MPAHRAGNVQGRTTVKFSVLARLVRAAACLALASGAAGAMAQKPHRGS
jgi:hypothetical protein